MGSRLSPAIADMMMEDLEKQALSTFHNPPSIWMRYVDDVYAIVKTENVDAFHKHLNTINSSIQFTVEMETSGSIAFLDVLLTRELDGSLSTSIFVNLHLPVDIYHLILIILFPKKLVLFELRTLEQKKSLTKTVTENQNEAKSKTHCNRMDFLFQCVQIHFFLKQHKTGNPQTITLLLFPFHMCTEFLSLVNVFWLKLASKWH